MSIITAVILGLIQGLTEFIPVSSTAHLTLAGRAYGLIDPAHPEGWTKFMAIIQLGTLVAVMVYFRRELVAITRAFVAENTRRVPLSQQSVDSRTGWYVILGTVPIVAFALVLKPIIEGPATKNLAVIGSGMVLLALLLWIAERRARLRRALGEMTATDALIVGLLQALALVPGVSRSGSTITAGLFRGFNREAAARFSFLLSVPAIGLSGAGELLDVIRDGVPYGVAALVAATLVAGVSGYASIAFLLRFLRTHTTGVFIGYRLVVGGAILGAIAAGLLAP